MRDRETRKFEKHAERPDDPQKRANDESQADEPAAFCPREQKIRNKLREQKHFDEHVDEGLQQCVPRARDKDDHAARGLGRDQHQPEIREQAKSGRGARALQAEVRFDLGLEEFEMLADAALVHAAQFAVDPVEVRENDEAHAERRDSEHVEKRHHRSDADSQPFAQAALEAVHFSVVGFVVEPRQMDHAVEDQDAHFNGQGTRKAARIAARGFRRDGDVADIFRALRRAGAIRGKGKHIGGPLLFAKRLVEPRHGVVADQLDGHGIGSEAEFAPGAFVELLQGVNGHGHAALAVDDHRNRNNCRAGFSEQVAKN